MGWGLILLTVGSLGCDPTGGTPTDSPPEDLPPNLNLKRWFWDWTREVAEGARALWPRLRILRKRPTSWKRGLIPGLLSDLRAHTKEIM